VQTSCGSTGPTTASRFDLHNRGKRSIGVDLKHPDGVGVVLGLIGEADALIEGFRPGVTERLGIGPSVCLAQNPALVYGRMTGWGQDGPMAAMAGHDIDYIALSGALHAIGPSRSPVAPLNLVGDYGGGGMLLAVGVLAGVIHARSTGQGQVVDSAMVDGSALLTTAIHGHLAQGTWVDRRSSNLVDGGAPWYSVYETSDGRHVAVGALEPHFFAILLDRLGLGSDQIPDRDDRSGWPEMRRAFQVIFSSRTRDEWAEHFEGWDACVTPVLSLEEAGRHPHNRERGTFVAIDGVNQPNAAPRFSATPAEVAEGPSYPGRDTDMILGSLGYSRDDIDRLRRVGAVA
jgi:alpha-methylacyl-CoA racemase